MEDLCGASWRVESVWRLVRMKEVSIARIRAQFPDPISMSEATDFDEQYCVGGAFLMFSDPGAPNFPVEDLIAEKLRAVNPTLSEDMALGYAEIICSLNESEEYEDAWANLEHALTHHWDDV